MSYDPPGPDWRLRAVEVTDDGRSARFLLGVDPGAGEGDETRTLTLTAGAIVGLGRSGPALYDGRQREEITG